MVLNTAAKYVDVVFSKRLAVSGLLQCPSAAATPPHHYRCAAVAAGKVERSPGDDLTW